MLSSKNIKHSRVKIQRLLLKDEASFNKTAQLQQELAQLEAFLSREEKQRVRRSLKIIIFVCVKKLQTLNSYLRFLKNAYKYKNRLYFYHALT
tara:strand:- start:2107 stop:2385 length:279 start_codon:yes stop_codon:yes gene_type:complete